MQKIWKVNLKSFSKETINLPALQCYDVTIHSRLKHLQMLRLCLRKNIALQI